MLALKKRSIHKQIKCAAYREEEKGGKSELPQIKARGTSGQLETKLKYRKRIILKYTLLEY